MIFGPVRRKAYRAAAQTEIAAIDAQSLIAEIKDGVRVKFEFDEHSVRQLISILAGNPGTLPVTLRVLIDEDD